jgi:hypothetical protein
MLAFKNGDRRKYYGLRHEHAVPRSLVIEMLRKLESPTPEMVYSICERYLCGVVVTKEEDDILNFKFRKDMPPEFFDPNSPDYEDAFLRYKRCDFEIVEPPEKWWLNIAEAL